MKTIIVAVLAVALAVSSAAAQKVYRWVDEKGVTHFTSTPVEKKFVPPQSDDPQEVASPRVKLWGRFQRLSDEMVSGTAAKNMAVIEAVTEARDILRQAQPAAGITEKDFITNMEALADLCEDGNVNYVKVDMLMDRARIAVGLPIPHRARPIQVYR